MNMKRVWVTLVLGLFLVSMMGGVLALTPQEIGSGAAEILKGTGTGLKGFVDEIFGIGNEGGLSEFFFVLLLAMIIYTAISSFFSETGTLIRWVITISISAIAYIGIPDGYLDALLVSYGAMGLAILTVIPFLIMVMFSVKVRDLMVARGTWIFYILYYSVLVIGKIWEDGDAHPAYWIAVIGGVVMFITIPWIRSWIVGTKLEGYIEKGDAAIRKNKEIKKLAQQSDRATVEAATS